MALGDVPSTGDLKNVGDGLNVAVPIAPDQKVDARSVTQVYIAAVALSRSHSDASRELQRAALSLVIVLAALAFGVGAAGVVFVLAVALGPHPEAFSAAVSSLVIAAALGPGLALSLFAAGVEIAAGPTTLLATDMLAGRTESTLAALRDRCRSRSPSWGRSAAAVAVAMFAVISVGTAVVLLDAQALAGHGHVWMALVGLMLLGTLVWSTLALAVPAVIVEGCSARHALRRSLELARHSPLRIAGGQFAAAALVVAASLGLLVGTWAIAAAASSVRLAVPVRCLGALAAAALMARGCLWLASVSSLMYLDARFRYENLRAQLTPVAP